MSAQRKVKIYFDSNDEFVREEQLPEMLQSARSASHSNSNDESLEELSERQRIIDSINFKYRAVNVFFGNEEQALSGTTRITRNIFAGTQDRNENAMLFLENLNKIKQSKNSETLSKQALLLRKLNNEHGGAGGCMSNASYPTQLDGAD